MTDAFDEGEQMDGAPIREFEEGDRVEFVHDDEGKWGVCEITTVGRPESPTGEVVVVVDVGEHDIHVGGGLRVRPADEASAPPDADRPDTDDDEQLTKQHYIKRDDAGWNRVGWKCGRCDGDGELWWPGTSVPGRSTDETWVCDNPDCELFRPVDEVEGEKAERLAKAMKRVTKSDADIGFYVVMNDDD